MKYKLIIDKKLIDEELWWILDSRDYCSASPLIDLVVAEVDRIWNDHEADLRRLSLAFDEYLFILSTYEWREYFFGGKMQYAPAVISYAEFDERKLA